MKTFLVGGCIRDILRGVDSNDRDWLVVGSSPEYMASLGYQEVGADFPVFLHPETGEEYALARTERKSGKGYLGFTVETNNVSLVDDLSRRDFTMNAIAWDPEEDEYHDPFNGISDIENKIIRHIGSGVSFAEDPVRVLRAARFAANFEFSISDETLDLMKKMVLDGLMDELTPERIILEMNKVKPGRAVTFLNILSDIGAYAKIFPNITADPIEMGDVFLTLVSQEMEWKTQEFWKRYPFFDRAIKTKITAYQRLKPWYDQIEVIPPSQLLDIIQSAGGIRQNDVYNSVIFELMRFKKGQGALWIGAGLAAKTTHLDSYEGMSGNEIKVALHKKRIEKLKNFLQIV